MKNPLDKDVIIANAVAAGTGLYARSQGARGLDAFNIAMAWRYWYKNMTMSIVLWFVILLIALHTNLWPYLVAQSVLNVLALGITYAKLVIGSDFQQRWLFRVFWPAARHFPYTARFWFYLSLLLPIWLMMFFRCMHVPGGRW